MVVVVGRILRWRCTNYSTSWTVRSSHHGGSKRVFFTPKNAQTGCGAHPAFLFNGYQASLQGVKRPKREKLTTPLHLVPSLRMSGVIPLLPPIFFHGVDMENLAFVGTARFSEYF